MLKKNRFSPRLMTLEGRDQPGSLLTTGLDASILAGAFLGDGLVKASRPAFVAAQAPVKKAEAGAVTHTLTNDLEVPSSGTIKQADTQSIKDLDNLNVFAAPNNSTALTFSEYINARPELYHLQRPGSETGTRGISLFYGGDFDGRNGLANEANTLVSDARTYDDVRIRQAWTIDCIHSNNLMNFTGVTSANWQIRGPGVMSTGNGLALFASGTAAPATQTFKSPGGFGFTEYKIEVCGLNLSVPSGHYYINVQPIGFGSARSFNSTTSGGGPIKGQPIANDDTWFDSTYYGLSYVDTATIFGAGTWDFSNGMDGTIF